MAVVVGCVLAGILHGRMNKFAKTWGKTCVGTWEQIESDTWEDREGERCVGKRVGTLRVLKFVVKEK